MIHEETAGSFDKSKWHIQNNIMGAIEETECGGQRMLGGYG